jgi:hypothetical protein
VGDAAVPVSDLTKGRPGIHEMVRVHDQHGLYQVRGIDRRNRTVHVTRNLPKNPIKEDVPFEAIHRLEKHITLIIDRFLNS